MRRDRWIRHAVLAALLPASSGAAQTVLASGSTSVRYIELRPFVRDSVPADVTVGDGLLRQLPDGRVVRCLPGEPWCRDVRPGEAVSTVPVIHDLNLSAFGFGRGLRIYAHVRGRSALGGGRDLWPQEDDHFEVMALYGEMERDRLRIRAGRQWKVSGLGYYNFDGLAVALRPGPTTWIEAYGGRSLVRGLNEARTGGALESIEDLSLPDAGILFGLHARYRPTPRLALSAAYQLDVRGDRAAAYSELAIADGVLRIGRGSVESSVELDLAGKALNQARVTLRSAPIGRTTVFAEARRYHPYFELWTIWGAFSPVGFDEARSGVRWASPDSRLSGRIEASWRRYEDAETDSPDDYRTTGWGAGAGATWTPRLPWTVDAHYRLESGFGASRWEGQAGIRRAFAGTGSLALQGVAFQRLYEFRLDKGTVVGLGGEGSIPIGERARAFASVMVYRQHGGGPSAIDWNQRRASLRFEWALGSEPGTAIPGAVR
jgi:opacity protein-like surface antigen